MTDLVERLRKRDWLTDTETEAADEIERLRQERNECERQYQDKVAEVLVQMERAERAEAALAIALGRLDLRYDYVEGVCTRIGEDEIDRLRLELASQNLLLNNEHERAEHAEAERDALRQALIEIRDATHKPAIVLRGMADIAIDAAWTKEGK